jgi:hypothetical protein
MQGDQNQARPQQGAKDFIEFKRIHRWLAPQRKTGGQCTISRFAAGLATRISTLEHVPRWLMS